MKRPGRKYLNGDDPGDGRRTTRASISLLEEDKIFLDKIGAGVTGRQREAYGNLSAGVRELVRLARAGELANG